eukprot:jgi/Astpho2/914/Aster-x0043
MASIKEKAGEMVEKVGKAFQDDGKVGKQFQDGKAAKTAQEAPTGATDKHGDIGKEFKSDGAVGGRVEKAAEKAEKKGKEMKREG